MPRAFANLHPFTAWRLRRRVKGGMPGGTSIEKVRARLGEPSSQRPGEHEGEEIWTYELAIKHGWRYRYSVLLDVVKQPGYGELVGRE